MDGDFFFSNEGDEPMHIHAMKAEKSCKFFIFEDLIEIELSNQKRMNNKDLKEVREIIFENFSYIVESWRKFHKEK